MAAWSTAQSSTFSATASRRPAFRGTRRTRPGGGTRTGRARSARPRTAFRGTRVGGGRHGWSSGGVGVASVPAHLCPGWIDTPFTEAFRQHQEDPAAALRTPEEPIPLRRRGVPEDIVGSVLFLVSPDAAYITGQAVVVDGGCSAV